MENLIPVINKLQGVFQKTGSEEINLPQIVVVGSQSSGKSSVLESLVGESFLPRGAGMVTRCPIILQLTPEEKPASGEDVWYCTFSHDKDKVQIKEPKAVQQEIERRTDVLAKTENFKEKRISRKPIIIEVHSSKAISLTVVDLPGIVKNPVGDQPADIEDQVNALIMKYIRSDNAIILAVTPANTDMATSESIKLAKQVDPDNERTLAVLTKLDMMGKGLDAKKALAGKEISMPLGIIGVVNRSQDDIDNNKSIQDAIESEKLFLEENYLNEKDKHGTPYLRLRLNQLLMQHIKKSFPELRRRIEELRSAYKKHIKSLGKAIPLDDPTSLNFFLFNTINDFVALFASSVERDGWTAEEDGKSFAARLAKINAVYSEKIRQIQMDGNQGTKSFDEEIKASIDGSVGVEGFTSVEKTFKSLTKRRILQLESTCMEGATEFHNVLTELIEKCLKDKRLVDLNSEISKITRELLHNQLEQTKEVIRDLIRWHSCRIFSMDEGFRKLLKLYSPEPEPGKEPPSNPNLNNNNSKREVFQEMGNMMENIFTAASSVPEGQNTSAPAPASAPHPVVQVGRVDDHTDSVPYVRELIQTYCGVVQKQIGDLIPKQMMYYMLDLTVEKMKESIWDGIRGRELDLVSEPDNIISERRETEAMLQSLNKATEIISSLEFP